MSALPSAFENGREPDGARAPRPRTGDTVKHLPTGELWTVAWADEGEVISCGRPMLVANERDCELIERCSDEKHWELIEEIALTSDSRSRQGSVSVVQYRCLRLLEDRLEARLEAECAAIMHL